MTENGVELGGSAPKLRGISELGISLGAFCDVARSIGMEVLTVSLCKRADSSAELADVQRRQTFPKDKARRTLKLLALIQTFSDNVYVIGYFVKGVDLKQADASRPGDSKEWEIRVVIDDAVAGAGGVV